MSIRLLAMMFLLTLFMLKTPLGKCELEWTTTYEINVYVDGSAAWIIERRAFLITDCDMELFFNYSSLESFGEFTQAIQVMVGEAWQRTGRDMNVEDFRITFNLFNATVGYYGTIKYEFYWSGFAKKENGTIKVGDVFDGQYIDLLPGDTLVINFPEGYTAVSIPQGEQSNRALKWYGPKNFSIQEPTVILQQASFDFWETLRNYALAVIGMTMLGMISVGIWILRLRNRNKMSADINPLENIPKGGNGENEIIAMLNNAGGILLQSTITKKCGFSKAKTSLLLRMLEEKGKVKRQKKGREKLVKLLTS